MIIGDLFHSLDRDAVIRAAMVCDGDMAPHRRAEFLDSYRGVWDEILRLQPALSTLICVIRRDHEMVGDEGSDVVVSGREPGAAEYVGIEFVPWQQWLTMPVEVRDGLDLSPTEILGAVLAEMTWFGFDQTEIMERKTEIVETVETLVELHGDGRMPAATATERAALH